MKITDVTTMALSYPVEKPFADSRGYIAHRNMLLVEVHTDAGITGYGDAILGGGPFSITKAVIEQELKPHLLEEDPFYVERIWEKLWQRSKSHGRKGLVLAAMSGIDIALWDIVGKATQTPIYKLLGAFRDKMLAYASGGFYEEDKGAKELAQEMASYVAQGFKACKMKVGRDPSELMNPLPLMAHADYANVTAEQDLERVAAVRQAIGKDVKLMVDANCAWTPYTAIKMVKQMETYDIYWIEEPVPTDDVEGSAKVVAAVDTPVAGYETEVGRYGFKELITKGAIDIAQPDVTWTGGITECRKIAAFASCYNIPVVPHSFGSGLSLLANMHLIASIPNAGLLEFSRHRNPLRDELFTETIAIDSQGYVHMPQGPGLGLELNWDTINKYRVQVE